MKILNSIAKTSNIVRARVLFTQSSANSVAPKQRLLTILTLTLSINTSQTWEVVSTTKIVITKYFWDIES